MKITRDNYEIFFIDYLDGTLPPELIGELEAFLLVNRDLEEQLQAVEHCRLSVTPEHFSDKESLKKDTIHECPDYYAIATAENALSENDRKVLGKRIDSEVFQTLTQIYRTLKLRPDLNIHFEKKACLYRKSPRRILFRTISVAAGLLLLAGIGISLLQTGSHSSTVTPSYSFALPQPEEVILPAEPLIAPVKAADRLVAVPSRRQSQPVKQIPAESKTNVPERQLSAFPVASPVFAKVENDLPENPLELIARHPSADELLLTTNARIWKQSGEGILENNIIGSAYHSGKNLAGKIKEKITEMRSNKSIPEYVIE